MVHGGDDVEFEFAVRGGEKDARVDFDLFDAGTIEGFEGRDDAGFFAGAGGAVNEEVGEIARLCL